MSFIFRNSRLPANSIHWYYLQDYLSKSYVTDAFKQCLVPLMLQTANVLQNRFLMFECSWLNVRLFSMSCSIDESRDETGLMVRLLGLRCIENQKVRRPTGFADTNSGQPRIICRRLDPARNWRCSLSTCITRMMQAPLWMPCAYALQGVSVQAKKGGDACSSYSATTGGTTILKIRQSI